MLPHVCSVIDHRWRQNVVRTKKVAHEAIAKCVTDVLTTFWRPLWSIHWTDARQHGIYLFYTIKKQTTTAFLFQNLSQLLEKPLSTSSERKKPFDVICCLYKMKQSHWLLCVAKNCDWSTKITPLSYLTQRASRGMKTYSEGKIELRNLQILKKILEKSSQFLSSEQPCEPKSLDVALNIAGVERIRSENLWLRITMEAIWFEFWM